MLHIKSGCYSATTKLYMIRLYRSLNEKDRRHYAAVEAQKLGHGCIKYIANLLGCSCQTIHTALSEMKKNQLNSETRVRSPGGGRKAQENKATVVKTFQAIIEPHVAGDPMNQEIRWLKISRAEISEKMKAAGICVSRNIISKLLKKHGFVKRNVLVVSMLIVISNLR